MEKYSRDLKAYTLTADEIEKLLETNYGSKIQPVDNVKLEKQRQQRARGRDKK